MEKDNESNNELKKPVTTKRKISLLLKALTVLLVPIIFVFYLSPQMTEMNKELKNNSNLKIYTISMSIASKMPDSAEKSDFIDYTTKAMADKKITHKEQLTVEAKAATLVAQNPEKANILEKTSYMRSLEYFKKKVANAETLPDSAEKEDYLAYAAEALADDELTKRETLAMDAKYATLMSVQEYRQMTVGLKIKEWWRAKHQ